jgi:hypothetical protein
MLSLHKKKQYCYEYHKKSKKLAMISIIIGAIVGQDHFMTPLKR